MSLTIDRLWFVKLIILVPPVLLQLYWIIQFKALVTRLVNSNNVESIQRYNDQLNWNFDVKDDSCSYWISIEKRSLKTWRYWTLVERNILLTFDLNINLSASCIILLLSRTISHVFVTHLFYSLRRLLLSCIEILTNLSHESADKRVKENMILCPRKIASCDQ